MSFLFFVLKRVVKLLFNLNSILLVLDLNTGMLPKVSKPIIVRLVTWFMSGIAWF